MIDTVIYSVIPPRSIIDSDVFKIFAVPRDKINLLPHYFYLYYVYFLALSILPRVI